MAYLRFLGDFIIGVLLFCAGCQFIAYEVLWTLQKIHRYVRDYRADRRIGGPYEEQD